MSFHYKKAAQALNYFATRNGGTISKLHALKLVFLADRYHLRKYSRPVIGDQYWAMNYGPVASGVKEMAELDSLSGLERHYAERFLAKGARAFDVVSRAPCDESVFSVSDREALEFAWARFGRLNLHALIKLTHLYPEWKRHEVRLKSESRIPMSYDDFFSDPPVGVEPCHPLTDAERADGIEQMHERAHIEALLG